MTVPVTTTADPQSPWTPDKAWYREALADQPRYRLDQLWHGLYRVGAPPADQTNLPKSLRAELAERVAPALSPVVERSADDGRTAKWLWALPDGDRIESVLMHYRERSTVCVSSQAGCAMGCGFCATGQAGYRRNLSVGEILEQVVAARRAAPGGRLNVVFMGMGEPLANYDRLIESLHRIIADLEIGARHVTVSTVGLVPQMLRLAEEGLQVGLALSLHAARDDLRTELVPLNRRHPIEDLVAACQLFRERTGRRVSLEWAMIDGTNDTDRDADELADVARAARAHVNLIPLNPTPGWPTVGTPPDRIDAFVGRLRDRGLRVTVRDNRGTDIDAACGQLAAASTAVAGGDPTTTGAAVTPVALGQKPGASGPG
ncbi:MAG: 23S rRNA (adenine(2503)-C(2))-methyltransferase RlmN [Actinomycetota bacterium]